MATMQHPAPAAGIHTRRLRTAQRGHAPAAVAAVVAGAAMLAGIGAGIFKDAAEATEATIVVTGSTDPNQQTHEAYTHAFDLYRSLYPQLKGSFQEMAEFSSKKAE